MLQCTLAPGHFASCPLHAAPRATPCPARHTEGQACDPCRRVPTCRYDWTEEQIHLLITNKGLALDPKDHGAVVENPLAAQVCGPCGAG